MAIITLFQFPPLSLTKRASEITVACRQLDLKVQSDCTGRHMVSLQQALDDLASVPLTVHCRPTPWARRLAGTVREAKPKLPVIYATCYTVNLNAQVPGSVFFKKPYRPSAIAETMRTLVAVSQNELS